MRCDARVVRCRRQTRMKLAALQLGSESVCERGNAPNTPTKYQIRMNRNGKNAFLPCLEQQAKQRCQLRLLSKGNGDWVARRVAGGETHASGRTRPGTNSSKDEAFGGRLQTTNQNHLETSTKQAEGRMGVGRPARRRLKFLFGRFITFERARLLVTV